jgi:hypothetical protein
MGTIAALCCRGRNHRRNEFQTIEPAAMPLQGARIKVREKS